MIDGLESRDYKAEDITVSDDLIVNDLISGNNVAIAGSFYVETVSASQAFSWLLFSKVFYLIRDWDF